MDDIITLAHGNGGRHMRKLIERLFVANFAHDAGHDAAPLPTWEATRFEAMITTDGYTVQPLEFPGGDIGRLAVHGAVNDLAVSGAKPLALTVATILEEGLSLSRLECIVRSMAAAARECDARIVAGDTKVVAHGEGGGMYLTVTAVGIRPIGLNLGLAHIRCGDQVLVSGPIGDHGAAIMLARGDHGLGGELVSDSASVLPLAQTLLGLPGLRFMRDPTRGGLATVAHEIAHGTGLGIRFNETQVPVRPIVRSVCDLLGYDPWYLACEGRLVAVVAPEDSETALNLLRQQPAGAQAAVVGVIIPQSEVLIMTALGGERWLEELGDDPLPRIC